MTTEVLNGGVPALSSESVTSDAAQNNAVTTQAPAGGAQGGNESQNTTRTYTEEEHREAIERATAKAAAKAERRAFREATQRLASQHVPQQQHAPQQSDGKPARAQYASDEAYVEALTDWKLEQRDRQAEAGRQQEQQRTIAQKTESIYAEAEKMPGFDRDAFDELPLTKTIVEALIDSEVPAKLMHYMAANAAEVERIAKLSPARQAAELGKLETKVAETKPPARSNAPTALSAVKGAGSTPSVPDPSKDVQGWIAWRNKTATQR